jgi:hypothetical protein
MAKHLPDPDHPAKELAEQFGLSLTEGDSGAQIEDLLTSRLEEMIRDDFPGLIRLLYRMDVNEEKLRNLLNARSGESAPRIMAVLIMERQREKRESRQAHRSNPPETGEERW